MTISGFDPIEIKSDPISASVYLVSPLRDLPDPVKMLNSADLEAINSGLLIIRGFTENRRFCVPGKVRL